MATLYSQKGDTMDNSTVAEDDIADISLLDMTEAVPQAPADTPSAPVETPTNEGTDTEAAKPAEAAAPDAKNETEATAAPDKEAPQETQAPTEEQPKGPDPLAAARAFQERQRAKQQVEQQINEVYAPRSEDQLIEENLERGLPEDQARIQAQIQAIREESSFREERARIAELNATMQAEAVNVMHEFPVFDEKSPNYDQEFTQQVFNAYNTAARVQTDERGIILNAEVPLYDFYKQMADIYSRGASKGTEKGQADTMAMLSRTEDLGGSSSTTKGPETLEDMEARLADIPL